MGGSQDSIAWVILGKSVERANHSFVWGRWTGGMVRQKKPGGGGEGRAIVVNPVREKGGKSNYLANLVNQLGEIEGPIDRGNRDSGGTSPGNATSKKTCRGEGEIVGERSSLSFSRQRTLCFVGSTKSNRSKEAVATREAARPDSVTPWG